MSSPETPNILNPGEKILEFYRDVQVASRQADRLYTSRPESLRKIYTESLLGALSVGAEDEIVILSEQQQTELADNARQTSATRLLQREDWGNAHDAAMEASERFTDFAKQYTGKRVVITALQKDSGAIRANARPNGDGECVNSAKGKLTDWYGPYIMPAFLEVQGRGFGPLYEIRPLDYRSLEPRVSIEFKD